MYTIMQAGGVGLAHDLYRNIASLPSLFMFDQRRRYWLLTWTTYGTWLPGDERGFVSPVRENSYELWRSKNQRGTAYSRSMPGL
jgi:hypothetical protein